MSVSSSSSPERYCLGGLMKDIDKEPSPRDYDFDSKDETSYKTSGEQKLSLDSIYSFRSSNSIFTPSIEKSNFNSEDAKIKTGNPFSFSKKTILSSFTSQKTTIILQKSLNNASKETLDNIIDEMSGCYSSVIRNKNGNYFCSDLFKVCDKSQRIKVLKELSNTLSEDCIDEYGTHPIQTLIELAESEDEYKLLLLSFNDYNKILRAALSQNGTYVIQKLIRHIPEKYRMEFNLIFVKFVCILSMDMYGVCTVIKFINYTKNEIIEKQLLNLILTNFVNISENQYGNYLVQNIMEQWWKTSKGIYLKKICIDKFHLLAGNHYSSYVCDIFLKLSSLEDKKLLMSSLINCKTINLFNCSNSGKIIMNKLMNALRQTKDSNNYKNCKIPNNFNNIKVIKKEKNEITDGKSTINNNCK
jgi:hypothetical protein